MGRILNLSPAPGVSITAYRADPQGTPRGGLVVIQEIFGVNSHIRSVCDGYAADGYLAIAPALFDRIEPGVDIGYTPPDIARGRDFRAKAGAAAALADIASARDVAASAGKVGVIGYCWGGYLAWLSAARVDGLACAICYYGGGMHEAVDEKPKVSGARALRREGFHDPRRRREEARGRAPGGRGALLSCRPRVQLRPARLVRRTVGEDGPRALARIPAQVRGIRQKGRLL